MKTFWISRKKLVLVCFARLMAAAVLALMSFGAEGGAVLTTLHSFQVFTNAAYPEAGLVQGSDGYFYGTTSIGGTNGGAGTVFKISTNGMLTSLYSFTGGNDGASPEAVLVQGSDGSFYGTTEYGGSTNYNEYPGTYGYGTIFKISSNGALTTLYSFSGGNDGAYPEAGVVRGSDGNFYGTTYGSPRGPVYGTVFEISPQGAFTSLYSFTGGTDGSNPSGLVQGSDGYFYGTTLLGGASGSGTVFKISPQGAFISLYSFTGGNDGLPEAGLVQGGDGFFYGTSIGTVFRISTNGMLTTLHSFDGVDGGGPEAGLVQGRDGSFYGTTEYGGGVGGYSVYGTVFKISSQGAFTSLYSFTGGTDGSNPSGLVQGSDGDFYGTASLGGRQNGPLGYGTVFKISANGALTSLYSFIGDNDGAHPAAGLVQGSDGFFYGTTSGGSPRLLPGNGYGTVFKISAKGALSTLYSFGSVQDSGRPLDGAYPSSALAQGSDGYLYGTTIGAMGSDVYSLGTVFRISTNGVLTTLIVFGTNSVEGAYPNSVLAQGTDGFFYGTTEFNGYTGGGALGYYVGDGTVFKISTNGTLTTLYAFGTVTNAEGEPLDGADPNWLARGSDGLFYGTTEGGGANDDGSVFQISSNGALNSLYSFSGGNAGAFGVFGLAHLDGLVQCSDGFFYGTTYFGGANGDGSVFKISTNGTFTSLYSFGTVTNADGDPLDGANPVAGLVQGSDGNFYGATQEGGTYNAGSLFQISSNGTLTTLYSFTGTNDGAYPEAGLAQGSDGSFYGTTYGDGQGGAGTVFRLTIVPEIQTVTLTNGVLSLAWSTETGGAYELQYTSDLSSTNWASLGNAVIATGSTLNITDSVTNGSQRFYRLLLSP